MTIGIDANWAIYENAGIGKYSYFLIKELLTQDRENNFVLFANFFRNYEQRKAFLEQIVKESGNKKTKIYISKIPSQWRDWITQTSIPLRLIFNCHIDVYYSPYFGGIAVNGFKKQAVTIHDIAFIKYPEHINGGLRDYYLKRTKIATDKSDLIIAVSESTKKDLVDSLSIPSNKIQVVYEGVDKKIFYPREKLVSQTRLKKYGINKPYILSVCTLEPRKNLEKLIDAFGLLDKKLLDQYQLVLVGKNGWNNDLLMSKINKLKKSKRAITTGYVPDEDLPYFYSGAELFVYPSLYEGFGLPPLEAMASGCPVITSNISSLPEVVGSSEILVDSDSVKEIQQAIVKKLNEKKADNQESARQASNFSWESSAKKMLALLNNI